ncbi:MAG: NUDIX hydrolase [Trueperaceae bacterium]
MKELRTYTKLDRISKEEQEFLRAYDASNFEKPSVTVDTVILTVHDNALKVLLVKRLEHPFKDAWSLPGGFVGMQESLDEAATRVLEQKGQLKNVFLEQLYTFGSVKRDPRMRIISVSYYALVEYTKMIEKENVGLFEVSYDDKKDAVTVKDPVKKDGAKKTHVLAFDHAEILATAIKRIRGKLEYAPLGFELLPKQFTLRQLQEVHETILDRPLNKDSFRRKVLASGLIKATGKLETGKDFRPAELYEHQ